MPHDAGAEVAAAHGLKRSDQWPRVERAFRKAHPTCAACDSASVQVHHVLPFHFAILLDRPDLELDPRNLIALCESEDGTPANDHHLLLGHLDDFETYNPAVRQFATTYHGQDAATIRAAVDWQAAANAKPPAWGDMTDDEKMAMRTLMDTLYPLPAQETPMAARKTPAKAVATTDAPVIIVTTVPPHHCNSGHACSCPNEGRHGCAADTLRDGEHIQLQAA